MLFGHGIKAEIHFTWSLEMEDISSLRLLLQKRDLSLSVAESLTGGMLSATIVGVSGISSYYRGGVTVYALQSKEDLLGIPLAHTQKSDAVDSHTARLMAKRVCGLFHSDIGLATTGIAERWDEREEQAFVALAHPKKDYLIHHHLCFGDRIVQEAIPQQEVRPFVRREVTNFCVRLLMTYLDERAQ